MKNRKRKLSVFIILLNNELIIEYGFEHNALDFLTIKKVDYTLMEKEFMNNNAVGHNLYYGNVNM